MTQMQGSRESGVGLRRVAIVGNPRAGRCRGEQAMATAAAAMREAGWKVSTCLTDGPGDAVRLAREASGQGVDIVFACGGDGTFSQVVSGLLDTGIPAGLIPAGTGNDFARTLGISRDLAAAPAQLLHGKAIHADLLEVDGGQCWSINIVGTGFDAAVSCRINRRRRFTGGLLAYLAGVLQELITYRPLAMRLQVDGNCWEGDALLVAIANSNSYGAGMMIAPDARIDDGLLDVVLVRYLNRLDFIRSFHGVLTGTHIHHPSVHIWRGRQVRIETDTPAPVLVDGDVVTHTPIAVQIAPRRTRLWVPAAFAVYEERSAGVSPARNG